MGIRVRMYCSELIWKVFERVLGIELCEPSRLGDFDLADSAIASKLWERYGSEIPIDEKVVSPAALFKSSFLVTVVQK